MKLLKSFLALAALSFAFFLILDSFQTARFGRLPIEAQKAAAAENIVSVFEKNLDQLSAEKRGHFIVRRYRLSGDEKYVPEIRSYAERLVTRFKTHAQNLDSPEYIQNTAAHFLKMPEKPLLKHRYRLKHRSQWPEMAFAHRLLFLAFQIKSFGFHEGGLKPDFEKALEYLRGLPYLEYLRDENIIRYNSTRAVNMMYQLKFLGLGDYEKEFTEKLRAVFFEKPDSSLDRTLYLNKIYGLTHLMIAASDFYQHSVPAEKFSWILDYFEENLDTLLVRNSVDTVAELAVCLKLAGAADRPAVKRIQEFLVGKFDPKRGLMPSDHKQSTWDSIEHRNVLSWMALEDWKELHAGPDLIKSNPA